MFIGEYTHNLDQKGRLAIPVKFRAQLGEGAFITRGLDQCLFVYATKDWEVLAEKLNQLPISQANSRAFARLMLAGAMAVDLDVQGRILVPDYLRAYSGLKKKAVVAGLYGRIEIWDDEKWTAYKNNAERQSDEIAEKMGELGI